MLLALTPLTELKSPSMNTWLLSTAMANTIGPVAPLPPATPDPSFCQVVPSNVLRRCCLLRPLCLSLIGFSLAP